MKDHIAPIIWHQSQRHWRTAYCSKQDELLSSMTNAGVWLRFLFKPGEFPVFKPINTSEFKWGTSTKGNKVMTSEIVQVFDAVVHFWKNLFKLPSGTLGKRFVTRKAKFFQAFAAGGEALEQVAMKHLWRKREHSNQFCGPTDNTRWYCC